MTAVCAFKQPITCRRQARIRSLETSSQSHAACGKSGCQAPGRHAGSMQHLHQVHTTYSTFSTALGHASWLRPLP